MAEVYEAIATGLDGFERRVAIKRMLPDVAMESSSSRGFLDEAQIISRLHHGNVVGILDYGLVDGAPFQVLEFVDGLDARALLQRVKKLPIEIALYICNEVGHALEHTHAACDFEGKPLGIVHRDVKPGNILLSWDGDVKLSDFGIAFANERTDHTLDGAKGTPAFMPPEQLLRSGIDGRSDLFALGCVLHALVVGHSPLRSEQEVARLLQGKRLELTTTALPPDVLAIIERAISPQKTDRFADAREMTEALGRAMAQRLDRDAKSALRELLAELRTSPQATSRSAAKLDGLLNLEIVLEAESSDRREFTSTELPATRPGKGGTPTANGASPTVPGRQLPLRLLAAAVGFGLTVAGGVALYNRSPAAGVESPPPSAPLMQATPADRPPTSADVAGTTVALPAQPAVQSQLVPPVVAPEKHERRRDRKAASKLGSDGLSFGVLSIAGAKVLRAEIFIDGKASGFAPKQLELPIGPHTVSLRLANGESIGPSRLSLTTLHSPASPLRYPQ